MKNYLIFDGIDSRDYHVYLADLQQFAGAEKVIERTKVPGRSGDLVYSDGSYENVDVEYNLYSSGDTQTDVDAFREAVMSRSGYIRLEDTLHPDEYRMGTLTGTFNVSSSDRKGSSITLTFSCKPQRFLRSGEITKTLTTAGMMQNLTHFTAKPLIRAYGTGTITANGKSMTVTSASGYTDLDSDVMDAYKGSENRNAYVKGDFIELVPGKNNISFTGFTRVDITPRWWKI